ncbi:hypothetical protein COL82_29880 [Bacillus toyonensis]|uniref:restriction endonuclease subunit S n=1 Tax=Bacillus toyonensis TaxID=155322 RepID=UPI000BF6A214|nr:restriction endonuclease subunit S [Bacillus toyonensis]PFZ70596.1 hypothetical protein COL82_29880 [Bacillus toyonensis]
MESKWETILLKDICDYKTGRLNSNAAEDDGIYPFFTCSPEVFKISTYAFDQDAVILGGNNANGKFPLKRYEGKFNAYQRTYVMASKNNDIIDNTYLYYYLLYKLNYLKNLSIGSATKFLTKTILDRLEINYPRDNHQMRLIGQILAKIDSKISLNQDIISNLEHLAQTLFKHWFINFEFPNEQGQPYKSSGGEMVESELGEIPTGWQVKCLEDVFSLKRGYDLPVSKREEGLIPIVSSSGVNGYHNVAKGHGPGVITGRSGKLGNVFYIKEDYWPLNTTLYVEDFKNNNPIYIYFLMKTLDFESLNAGSSVPTLNRNHVHKLKVVSSKKELVEKFGTLVDPIFEKKDSLIKEIEVLNKVRDTLLPKLLSGGIKISGNLEVE